jgi:hypothetical protein
MQKVEDFFISGFMAEMMCYVGQQTVYEEAAEIMEKLSGIKTNGKQIERVCHHYGQKLENDILNHIENQTLPAKYYPQKTYYIMLDGCMLLTREESWKELKLCRIFSTEARIEINKNRNQISQSNYVGHLGSYKDFFAKVECHTDFIKEKIFVADGAKWIWKWIDDMYPKSIQILDFYHAKEHLCQFAEQQFKDQQQRLLWIDKQSLRLLNDHIEDVIKDLESMKADGANAAQMKPPLIQYYKSNSKRMKYKTFKENGWLIGSGAIEAANRHVIQQRMKLSGQRWTIAGAQQLLNLRMAHKSDRWDDIHNSINYKIAA